MSDGRELTSAVGADPADAGPDVTTAADVFACAFGRRPHACGACALAPGVVLVAEFEGVASRLDVRLVRLPHAPAPVPGAPATLAFAMTAPLAECARAFDLASELAGATARSDDAAGLAAAPTRTALARRLADAVAREGPLTLRPDELLALAGTSPTGLAGAEADRRAALVGANRLERARRRPVWLALLEQMGSFFAVLLWAGGALAVVAGMPQLGLAVFAVILVNGVFSFLQEHRAERALEALEALMPDRVDAWRDGATRSVAAAELVIGDVVELDEGDLVPADGVVLESRVLRLDQAALTGEPHPVFKLAARGRASVAVSPEERPERVFAGTSVVSGSGRVLVTATGMRTAIGGIAHLAQTTDSGPSPLQREMVRITRVITLLALGIGAVFFVGGVGSGRLAPREGFLFALGVIVANVPEGLLPTLTLALAMGVQRMARLRALVRRLSSVETLGAVQVICTDKTGTLTENRMALRRLWTAGGAREFDPAEVADAGVRALLEGGLLASLAGVDHGDPTEQALVVAAAAAGLDVDAARTARPVRAPLPFDSFRKRMTLVREEPGLAPVAWTKGAPLGVLARCDRVLAAGHERALTAADRAAITAEHDARAAEGLRMLAVARRPVHADAADAGAEGIERDLVLLGLVALWDPPRPDVPAAVTACRHAGIHVVIVTGDSGLTARAIATRVGLDVRKVVEGDEIERLPPAALGDLALEPGVLFARTSPRHKLAVVEALRRRDRVVAVTGDGVNDAPALKAADVGVAMGRRGSDVARESAAMVITDDHFATIVAAIAQGRAIWDNVGRFVRYVLTSNVPELVPFVAFVLLRVPLPLTVMQVLAVDLGTDLLPALALGTERPERDVMDRPPRPRQERLLSARRLLHAYGFLGLSEAVLAMAAFFWTYLLSGWRPGMPMDATGDLYQRATTMTFAGIVAAQVGNVFACRTERESVFRHGLASNRLVLAGVAAEVALLLVMIAWPPLRGVFGLAPLSPAEWQPLLAFPLVMLLLEETRKWIVRRIPTARR